MKRLLLLLALPLAAQTVYNYPTRANSSLQVLPQAIPTSAADVIVGDFYIDRLELRNTSAGALTCTVSDKQAGTPLNITPGAVSIAANTVYIFPYDGTWAPGGVRWVCSGTGVIGWLRGSKRATAGIVSTTGD
jgi:hypothetical protein